VGRRRRGNEDDFLMAALPTGQEHPLIPDQIGNHLVPSPGQTGFLFLVADGIGGVPCGERASSMAVRTLYRYLKENSGVLKKGRLEITRTLLRGASRCQSDLQAEVERRPECEGMGTTLTGILSLARRLYIVHSGDSRCYRLRGSTLNVLTDDHSQAQLEIDAGTMDREAARKSPGGNCLWNYLTSDFARLRPDVGSMPLEPGDIFLLCTDGISDAVPAEKLKQLLSSRVSAENICKSLIAAAHEGGGGDDLTVIVARFGAAA
jgi:PPM family protein phosphatase